MKFLWVLLILFVAIVLGSFLNYGDSNRNRGSPRHMFVFGDSSLDTGNTNELLENSWRKPYGKTFPGKPTGRSSDGRILTDFIAKFLGLDTPVTYRLRNISLKARQNGINFAYAGSGVFATPKTYPNLTGQINLFEDVLNDDTYEPFDIVRSVALISTSTNDYFTSYSQSGSLNAVQEMIGPVIDQLILDIKRIMDLGVRKIAVAGGPPLGCFPSTAISNGHQKCNGLLNEAVKPHNALLQEALDDLNKYKRKSKVIFLDLFSTFTAILQSPGKFGPEPLKPCCAPISNEYSCGDVDVNGNKLYTLCEDPESFFFWDSAHPTQKGWNVISSAFESAVESLF